MDRSTCLNALATHLNHWSAMANSPRWRIADIRRETVAALSRTLFCREIGVIDVDTSVNISCRLSNLEDAILKAHSCRNSVDYIEKMATVEKRIDSLREITALILNESAYSA